MENRKGIEERESWRQTKKKVWEERSWKTKTDSWKRNKGEMAGRERTEYKGKE